MKRALFMLLFISLIYKGFSEINPKSSYYGSWLSFDFVERLAESKNIYQTAHDFDYEILIIDPEFRNNDSVNIYRQLPCQTEHSGIKLYKLLSDSSMVYVGYHFDPDKMDHADSGKHSLRYSATQDIIERIHSDDQIDKKFIRLTYSVSNDMIKESLRTKMNELLIVGEYQSDNMIINFYSNGEIAGFKDYERFKLNLDYCFDSSLYDKISVIEFFKPEEKDIHDADSNLDNKYAVEIKNKKVMLYEIIVRQTDDYYGLVRGELAHEFKKKLTNKNANRKN